MNHKKICLWFLGALGLLSLSACGQTPNQDIVDFVEQTKKKKSEIKAIPDFKKPEPFFYKDKNLRDPFSIQKNQKPVFKPKKNFTSSATTYKGPTPDLKRKKEPLEDIAIDKIRMVGSLSKEGKIWALVKSPEGIVHRVFVGNFMGQNFGKIYKITDTQIQLQEFIPDNEGGWLQRDAIIKMESLKQQQ